MSQREEQSRSKLSFFDSLLNLFKGKEEEERRLDFESKPKLCVCEVDLFDEPDDEGNIAEVITFKNGLLHNRHRVGPGDFFRASHTMGIRGRKYIEKDSPIFPIELEYAGVTYFLRATKNDKLILTK